MTLQLRVQPNAEADLRDAWQWYENLEPGLGDEFLRAVEACFERIQCLPDLFPIVHRNARQALLRRFPYRVIYVIREPWIDVIAVFHARRNPRGWQERTG